MTNIASVIRFLLVIRRVCIGVGTAASHQSSHLKRGQWHAFIHPAPARRDERGLCLRMSSLSEPDIKKFKNVIYASDDTVYLLREELKSRILQAADDFKNTKTKGDAIIAKSEVLSEEVAHATVQSEDKGYVFRLLSRIVRKVWRNKTSEQRALPRSSGILTPDSLQQIKLEVGAAGDKVIELAEQLSLLNPTPIPTLGFKNYGGAPPSDSKLAGNWKLRFTTAADASFPRSEKRGDATTSQVINAEEGTLTNVIDFEKGKLKGFRVVVEGTPSSATDIDLSFKAVRIFRKSRFPKIFGHFTFRLPSRFISWLASRNKDDEEKNRGPYLQLRYLDDDLRMHTTDSGNWFIQTRLY